MRRIRGLLHALCTPVRYFTRLGGGCACHCHRTADGLFGGWLRWLVQGVDYFALLHDGAAVEAVLCCGACWPKHNPACAHGAAAYAQWRVQGYRETAVLDDTSLIAKYYGERA